MIADETLQRVDAIAEVLKLPAFLQVVSGLLVARAIDGVVNLHSQVVHGAQITVCRRDAILIKLRLHQRVGLHEGRIAILTRIGHPGHLASDVGFIVVLLIGLRIPIGVFHLLDFLADTCCHQCFVEEADGGIVAQDVGNITV